MFTFPSARHLLPGPVRVPRTRGSQLLFSLGLWASGLGAEAEEQTSPHLERLYAGSPLALRLCVSPPVTTESARLAGGSVTSTGGQISRDERLRLALSHLRPGRRRRKKHTSAVFVSHASFPLEMFIHIFLFPYFLSLSDQY